MPGQGNYKTPLVSLEDAQKLAIAATEKNATLREKVLNCLKRYTNGNPAVGGMGGSGSGEGSGTKRNIDGLLEVSNTAMKKLKETTADIRQDLEVMDMLCTKVSLEPLIKVKELQVEEVKSKIQLEELMGKNAYDADFRAKEADIRAVLAAANAKEVARMTEDVAANAAEREENRRAKEQAAKDADLARDNAAKDADLAREENASLSSWTLKPRRLLLSPLWRRPTKSLLATPSSYLRVRLWARHTQSQLW